MKKIIFFICFSLVFLFCGLTCLLPTSFSFAEGETELELLDISAVLQSSKRQTYTASYGISEEGYVSKTVKILKEDGTEFLIFETEEEAPGEEPEEPSPEDPGTGETTPEIESLEIQEGDSTLYVVDPADLPSNVEAIQFSNNYFSITRKENLLETAISLKYQVVFTLEDFSTVTKTADIQIFFHNFNIVLKQNEVDCDLNSELTADSFKQYIDETESTVSLDDITAKFNGVDFYQVSNGSVSFTYENLNYEIDGKTVDIKIVVWLSVNVVEPDNFEIELEIGDGETYSNLLNLGEIEYEKNWQYSGKLKTNVKNATFTTTNTQNFLVDIEESETFGVYDFTVYSTQIVEGNQTIDFIAHFNTVESTIVTLELNFKISSTPQIILSTKTLTLDKGITCAQAKTAIEGNLVSVIDVLGDVGQNTDVIINDATISGIYEDDDIVSCGEYVVTYTYTSKTITHRLCQTTESITVSVVNTKPTIDKTATSVKVDGNKIENNSRVYVNKNLFIELSANDLNGDEIVFVLNLTKETSVVAGDANTMVVKNSNTKYTISSIVPGNTKTVRFTINAPLNYFGDFSFEILAYDRAETTPADAGDKYNFELKYYETGLPVIVLLTSDMHWDSYEEIHYLEFNQEFTARNLLTKYVVRVEDEFDETVNNSTLKIEVVKNSEKQQMVGTTFVFSEVGVYYINYSVEDVSGNKTTARFKIIVNETPNDTPTISPYILNLNEKLEKDFSYSETVVIDIDRWFDIEDDDAKCKNCGKMVLTGGKNCAECGQPDAIKDILSYYNEIGAFSAADTTSEKILCTNSNSFSWDSNYKVLTFKQDPGAYYVGKLYIAFFVDDNTGLQTGISTPAFIEITFVNNIPPTVTKTNAKTTYIIGKDDCSAFDKTAYFIATNDFDKTTITPVVNILDKNGNHVVDIDFTVVGTYTLNYYFRYEQGGVEHTITKTVEIKVTTGNKPNIVLKQEELNITVGDNFDIASIITMIEDIEDGNASYETLKDKITIEGMPQDLNVPGEYKITIKYTDSDENQVEKVFTLKISEKSKVWIYIVIGVAAAAVLAGVVVLIVFIARRRYTRI